MAKRPRSLSEGDSSDGEPRSSSRGRRTRFSPARNSAPSQGQNLSHGAMPGSHNGFSSSRTPPANPHGTGFGIAPQSNEAYRTDHHIDQTGEASFQQPTPSRAPVPASRRRLELGLQQPPHPYTSVTRRQGINQDTSVENPLPSIRANSSRAMNPPVITLQPRIRRPLHINLPSTRSKETLDMGMNQRIHPWGQPQPQIPTQTSIQARPEGLLASQWAPSGTGARVKTPPAIGAVPQLRPGQHTSHPLLAKVRQEIARMLGFNRATRIISGQRPPQHGSTSDAIETALRADYSRWKYLADKWIAAFERQFPYVVPTAYNIASFIRGSELRSLNEYNGLSFQTLEERQAARSSMFGGLQPSDSANLRFPQFGLGMDISWGIAYHPVVKQAHSPALSYPGFVYPTPAEAMSDNAPLTHPRADASNAGPNQEIPAHMSSCGAQLQSERASSMKPASRTINPTTGQLQPPRDPDPDGGDDESGIDERDEEALVR